jgi:hypothetical protein
MVSQIWRTLLPIALIGSKAYATCTDDSWDVIIVGTKPKMYNHGGFVANNTKDPVQQALSLQTA